MPRALIVDDDRHVRRVLAAALRDAGWESDEAASGDEVMDAARARRPDLIVLDLMIPGADGYAVLVWLKGDPELAHVPVVLVSGEAAEVHARMAREMGAAAFLEKPVDVAALQELLAG